MNCDDLKIVLAVARKGTLSGAAAQLGVDQSTVGRRLSSIEGSLGTVLFVRTRAGFQPTEAGEKVIMRGVDIENQILLLEDDVQASSDKVGGHFTIVGNHWTLERLLLLGGEAFIAQNPEILLQFVVHSGHWSLVQGRPEIALWFEIQPKEAEFAFPAGNIPYAVYHRADLDPDTLDWVSYQDPRFQRAPTRWLQRHMAPGEILRITANDATLVLASILAGAGKGLLPCCLAEEEPRIRRFAHDGMTLERTLYIHANPDLVQTRRVQRVIAWIQSQVPTLFADPHVIARPAAAS